MYHELKFSDFNKSKESFNLVRKRKNSRRSTDELNFRQKFSQAELLVCTNCKRTNEISRTQKSHYFVIMFLGLWLVLTSIPYYTSTTLNNINHKYLFSERRKSFGLFQAIASVFLNSNHCINFFVYYIFDGMFRTCFFKIFQNCFKKQRKNSEYEKTTTI